MYMSVHGTKVTKINGIACARLLCAEKIFKK